MLHPIDLIVSLRGMRGSCPRSVTMSAKCFHSFQVTVTVISIARLMLLVSFSLHRIREHFLRPHDLRIARQALHGIFGDTGRPSLRESLYQPLPYSVGIGQSPIIIVFGAKGLQYSNLRGDVFFVKIIYFSFTLCDLVSNRRCCARVSVTSGRYQEIRYFRCII